MGNYNCTIYKFQEVFYCFFIKWCVLNHTIIDTCKFNNLFRNWLFRINKSFKCIYYYTIFNFYCTDFCNLFFLCRKSCSFYIETNKCTIKTFILSTFNCRNKVINKIGFAAINNFDFVFVFINSFSCIHSFGECLCYTMVSNSNCFVSPFICTINNITCRRNTIHIGHIGMHM